VIDNKPIDAAARASRDSLPRILLLRHVQPSFPLGLAYIAFRTAARPKAREPVAIRCDHRSERIGQVATQEATPRSACLKRIRQSQTAGKVAGADPTGRVYAKNNIHGPVFSLGA
jgi:hypothetical protein